MNETKAVLRAHRTTLEIHCMPSGTPGELAIVVWNRGNVVFSDDITPSQLLDFTEQLSKAYRNLTPEVIPPSPAKGRTLADRVGKHLKK